MSLWWRIWHIHRWRLIANIFGSIARASDKLHNKWHPSDFEWCEACKLRKEGW